MHGGFAALQAADDPLLWQFPQVRTCLLADGLAVAVDHHKAGGVPDFVAKIAVAFHAFHVELDVAACIRQRAEGKTHCICTVGVNAVGKFFAGGFFDLGGVFGVHQTSGAFAHQRLQVDTVDQVERVEYVAFRLGHFLPFAITHQTMHIDGFKRHLRLAVVVFDKVQGHHNHAGNPEEDDVKTRHQHVGAVEGFQFWGVFWPAQGGERPQR